MATLTDADYTWIRDWVHNNRTIYTELSTWGLNKATWKAAFQAIENYMVSSFNTTPTTSIRAAIEAVTGITTTLQAQYLFVTWVSWKLYNYLSGG